VKLFFQIRLPFGSAAAFFLGLYIETKLWAWEPVSFHSIFEVYISMKSAAPSWQSDLEEKIHNQDFPYLWACGNKYNYKNIHPSVVH
jgi:hypothetical protein